jgi:hypothetical protein
MSLLTSVTISISSYLTRTLHESLSRDREDGRNSKQPQDVGPEAYLNGTSQGPTSEDALWTSISVVAASGSCDVRV